MFATGTEAQGASRTFVFHAGEQREVPRKPAGSAAVAGGALIAWQHSYQADGTALLSNLTANRSTPLPRGPWCRTMGWC